MNEFTDVEHSLSDLIFQGAEEFSAQAVCDTTIQSILTSWEKRQDPASPDMHLFELDSTRCFTIDYQGNAGNYWPDETSNFVGESIIRQSLFENGICNLQEMTPKLYVSRYKMIAMEDIEFLLVCPYPTAHGNIGGLIVVCVNKHISPETKGRIC